MHINPGSLQANTITPDLLSKVSKSTLQKCEVPEVASMLK
jgi:hypothetical protein